MPFLLFLIILIGLGSFIFIQYQKHHKANELYVEAKKLETKDTRISDDTTRLKQALSLYKQCSKLVNKPEFVKAANQCQQKIDDHQRFQQLLANGKKYAIGNFFKEALTEFIKAQKLFSTTELKGEISKCQEGIKQQENYEKVLKQSVQIAKQGQFQEAIDLLVPILDKFTREDGQQLLTKLKRVIQAKELYKSGLVVEKTGELNQAKANYEQALGLIPEFDECKIRLSILAVKHNPKQAISYLERIDGEQAAYIRGFAYTKLGNWQQADREWRSISKVSIEVTQRPMLKSLAERDRLNSICEIEKLLDRGQVEIAKSVSLEFIEKFGLDTVVKFNLENHIQPFLERQIWESQNWQEIAAKTEQIWLKQQDINSLHNWAIASYYLSQTDSNKLGYFIIAWSTALANIEHNPTLQNVPWLGSNSIDIKDVSAKLKQVLENAIDAVKDDDIEKYLKLRDIYRRDMVSFYQGENSSILVGVRVNRIFIPSGCYQRHRHKLTEITFPVEKLYSKSMQAALYTDWGLAVAACMEGDTARAIKIKPYENPSCEADNFACYFMSYHEGCHYLQNLEWRKAIYPLQQAKSEIKAKSDWCKEIDRLCELQRKKINDFDEHLQFSNFWYELLNSQPSRSYFAEYKGRQVAEKLSNETISYEQGLKKLQKIKDIDPNNSFILNLIETVEMQVELEKISRVMKREFKEGVQIAKRSRHEKVRFKVAEVCINVILEASESRSLYFDGMYQLAQWAYELCPREPAFQEIYNSLRIHR
ncbi:tetratricopeptide repeat protein [Pleurocapsa sp. FMAR1]|uniref:tetratricopeptide repeat protein n=1 Tax=Pleurocapsa sp. FMAR1 TaxID=3040204 RepID=UPI0029C95EDA|nr:hypothetical protein [Pleurocapsa sp. FMAR1]